MSPREEYGTVMRLRRLGFSVGCARRWNPRILHVFDLVRDFHSVEIYSSGISIGWKVHQGDFPPSGKFDAETVHLVETSLRERGFAERGFAERASRERLSAKSQLRPQRRHARRPAGNLALHGSALRWACAGSPFSARPPSSGAFRARSWREAQAHARDDGS